MGLVTAWRSSFARGTCAEKDEVRASERGDALGLRIARRERLLEREQGKTEQGAIKQIHVGLLDC